MSNALAGRPLRYLIGGDDNTAGRHDEVVELSYDATMPAAYGVSVKYANLFCEKYATMTKAERASYGPYLSDSDTAAEYGEGQIDPDGQGWTKNLDEQFARAIVQGFGIIELDNPDAYLLEDVLGAVDRAHRAGLEVLAKNAAICQGDAVDYVGHPAVVGVVVEKGCGTPAEMEALRQDAGKPDLPVWFVAFGDGRAWAERTASQIEISALRNMGVTYATKGEYENSTDILVPVMPELPPWDTAAMAITVTATAGVRVIVNGRA